MWGRDLGHRRRLRVALGCGALALLLTNAAGAAAASFSAHGSVEQVYATGLHPSARTTLLARDGHEVATKRADEQGGVLFRHVRPGGGYRVRLAAGGPKSGPLRVLSKKSAPPDKKIYDQSIPTSGYGYMKTRDGIKLALDVHPPSDITTVIPGFQPPPTSPGAPTPTLVEYSGYGYADPAGPQSGISIIANAMGFTVVDVNMRGTGCSGGAFDFFEPLQSLDGYDVVETVAHQPWVAHNKVGMMGISYGGISQLFTAATDPPHLAAISPLSVIDQTQTTLYPGGVLNTGFAVAWAKERIHDAKPASPNGGQAWAYQRIQDGDQTCEANQALHGESPNLLRKIRANHHYKPKVADPIAPTTFVKKIKVPTYMACQWTDEQTGGHCGDLADEFTGTRRKWFTFTNGTHVDSLDPETFNRWSDFLELYVAKQAPITDAAQVQAVGPVVYQEAMGISGVTMPPDPIQLEPTYDGALAAFENLKPIRVLFDSGAGGTSPGQPQPGFESSFNKLPIPGVKAKTWYLSAKGGLGEDPSAHPQASSFRWDAHALPLTDFTGDTAGGSGGLWTATPPYQWKQSPAGSAVSYLSKPLTRDTTVIGAGALHLWVRSSAPNVDLQATVSEVRPDDKETFVQNGWVRGNERKLDRRKSTPLEPVLSLRKSDVSPLPSDRFVKVTVPLYYEGHAYRAGSRIRVTIAAPNGAQPIWSFSQTKPKGKATVAIASSERKRSRLTLPVVRGIDVPTGLPPCPGLRGEPCRNYKPLANHTAKP
jgi:predicted acyl esterase